jgi:hypothetical protein
MKTAYPTASSTLDTTFVHVAIGDLATIHIGCDCDPARVVAFEVFKSGSRMGFLKSVTVVRIEAFGGSSLEVTEKYIVNKWGRMSYCGSFHLSIGRARSYRDPHI